MQQVYVVLRTIHTRMNKKTAILFTLLMAIPLSLLLPSCGKSGDGGGKEDGGSAVDVARITVTDSGNTIGKWDRNSSIAADVTSAGKSIASGRTLTLSDATNGTMTFTLTNLSGNGCTLLVYSPASKSIASGQNSSTEELRAASSSFTPKKEVALSMNIAAVSASVTVSVNNENSAYSGWNLENVSLKAASAIAGTVDFSSSSPVLSSGSSNEIVYEFSSPSALRTKAQKAVFNIFPSISNGSNITLCYLLEKNGKRAAISHNLKFPQQSSAGAAISINETIPENIEGDWSAEGSGVVYTNVFPGRTWEETSPESRGYSSSKLDQLKTYLRSISTTSMMVAVGGKVIFSYGDVSENVKIASCRKSLLSTLYGNYVKDGTIDLNKTLAELGIDEDENSWGGSSNWDGGKLLESEKQATIKDLLTARSGIFHKPANSGDDHDYMSASDRGKYTHGTYYLYNNWDFNCAGGVFEQLTGKDIYAAFKTDIADPCQWQDYDLAKQSKTEEFKGASKFLAYHFIISTRDMLRMALLMLNKGNWDGKQIVPQDWAELITSTYTKREDMHPSYRLTREFEYGWLWWTFCPQYTGYDASIFEGGFTATGSGGQYITALPALNMVIAHKDKSKTMEKSTYYGIIKRLAACKE